jgi:hypothetical protein
MNILTPLGLQIVLHVFLSISIATSAEYSTMCIKPLRKILPPLHSDFIKIHAAVLDE